MKDIAPPHTARFRARLIPPPAGEATPAGVQLPERLLERAQISGEVEPENWTGAD
jgi:hypothetical protein